MAFGPIMRSTFPDVNDATAEVDKAAGGGGVTYALCVVGACDLFGLPANTTCSEMAVVVADEGQAGHAARTGSMRIDAAALGFSRCCEWRASAAARGRQSLLCTQKHVLYGSEVPQAIKMAAGATQYRLYVVGHVSSGLANRL